MSNVQEVKWTGGKQDQIFAGDTLAAPPSSRPHLSPFSCSPDVTQVIFYACFSSPGLNLRWRILFGLKKSSVSGPVRRRHQRHLLTKRSNYFFYSNFSLCTELPRRKYMDYAINKWHIASCLVCEMRIIVFIFIFCWTMNVLSSPTEVRDFRPKVGVL